MLLKQQEFYIALTSRFPGLVERIRRLIEDSERKFSGSRAGEPGFLWEHTVLVTALAFRLAKMEGLAPEHAAITALLHDAGKFAGGRYHRSDRAGEEEAARLARPVLISRLIVYGFLGDPLHSKNGKNNELKSLSGAVSLMVR